VKVGPAVLGIWAGCKEERSAEYWKYLSERRRSSRAEDPQTATGDFHHGLLGLHSGERRFQVEQLLSSIGTAPVAATILLGDINEGFLWGRPLRWLHRRFGTSPSIRTFPSRAPIFALDRMGRAAGYRGLDCDLSAPGLRGASDHLPVVASLRLPDAGQDLGQSSSQAGPLIASSG